MSLKYFNYLNKVAISMRLEMLETTMHRDDEIIMMIFKCDALEIVNKMK